MTLGAGGGTFLTDADTTLSGVISGAGALTKTGTANLTLAGANSYSGGTTVSAGTLTGTTTSLQGAIVNNAALVFDQAGAGTYAGNLSGTGTVTKSGAGAATFSGTNSYTGTTTVGAGTLIAGGTGIGDTSAVTVASGALLQLGGDETIGSLAGAGDLNTAAFTLTTGGDGTSTDFSGTATGSSLTKVGAGTMTLSGTGTLTGALNANGGTLAVGGTYASAANANAGGTLDVLGTGTLTGAVTSVAGSTVRINGVVNGNVTNAGTLAGAGTVNGVVTNNGAFGPGNSPGTFNINGQFIQGATGTLNAELTPTVYDQVSVTGAPGTATLDGTLALAPATGLYVSGTTYDVVKASNGITGDFATITGATISPFLSFADTGIITTTGTEQVYRVTVTRINYATGLGVSATSNQISVANGFQTLVAGATGDAALLVTGVDNLTAAQAQSFFNQASPEGYGAYATALQDQGELFTRQVASHIRDNSTGTGVWFNAYGQWGSGKNDGILFGSDQDIKGGAGGIDFGSEAFTFGAAVGYSQSDLTYRLGNSSGDAKGWQAGVYGAYKAGPISADVQLAYVQSDMSAVREINAGTIARTANADSKGDAWRAMGTLGYDFGSEGTIIRPFIGVDYTNGEVKGFTETGAGAADLTVGKIKADQTALLAGIELAGHMGGFSPYGRLTYRYLTDDNGRDITGFFNGNAASVFTVSGISQSKSQFNVDAGLSFALGTNASIFAGYQGSFRDDLTRHGVNGGVRVGF